MTARFSNSTPWFPLTAGLAVWAAHFMLLWAVSSFFPGDPIARWIALGLTVLAAAAIALIWRRARPISPMSVSALGLGIAGAGIAFSAAPALIG